MVPARIARKSAHLHQRVAAHQLLLAQRRRQDRVLHRAEQRRVGAHGEQRQQHQRQALQQEAGGTDRHDHDLGQLDQADQRVLGELLAELAAERGEQEERQDEQHRAQIDQQIAVGEVDPGLLVHLETELEQDGEDQRLLEQIVVERAEQLGDEERQEAPGAEQGELRIRGHRPCTCLRPSGPSCIGIRICPGKATPACGFRAMTPSPCGRGDGGEGFPGNTEMLTGPSPKA